MTTPLVNSSNVHVAWANGAPALVTGHNMAAVGNPGGTGGGQIQLNFTTGTPGVVKVTGNAGAGNWLVVPQGSTGLIKVVDLAGAAVNFGATTGFVFLEVTAAMAV